MCTSMFVGAVSMASDALRTYVFPVRTVPRYWAACRLWCTTSHDAMLGPSAHLIRSPHSGPVRCVGTSQEQLLSYSDT